MCASSLTKSQDFAANPEKNIWVQANAGTGKTKTLVQRLLRIFFRNENISETGILCLTYTNAAAGEMRNRILSELRTWAMASDEKIVELLTDTVPELPVTAADIAHAREIFFIYIDNPDILKIKTIHSFCEEILHRFPIEAGIPPSWTLIADDEKHVLQRETFDKMVNSATENASGNPQLVDAFARIVEKTSEFSTDKLLERLSEKCSDFFLGGDTDSYRTYFMTGLKHYLGLDTPAPHNLTAANANALIHAATTSKSKAKELQQIINTVKQFIDTTMDFSKINDKKYKSIWLTSSGEKRATVRKDGGVTFIGQNESFIVEQERIYESNQRYLNQILYDDTMALFDLAGEFAHQYTTAKQSRGVLDFDDMILYTRKLFLNPETMGWVLSQLNISLRYILVDEAQDTGTLQWDIMQMLSGDFFVDGDIGKMPRTLFFVGDSKQSIYGFQGADPRAFVTSRINIATQMKQYMRDLNEVVLGENFRSLPVILHTVDSVFQDDEVINISGFENNKHTSCRTAATQGMVEIHKLTTTADVDDDEKEKNDDIKSVLCMEYLNNIADKITQMIQSGECRAGDIMVLVKKRDPFAAPLVKMLKERNIDVAGSDRIKLPRFPAVRDMLHLVRFCINNRNDYSLCCVLKSPIFRLTERDIFNICKIKNTINQSQKNHTSVFEVMQSDLEKYGTICQRLDTYIQWASELGPYSFFTKLLNENLGETTVRSEIISALGPQVIDPIEEFMTICLSYERTRPGTMQHFIKWFITAASEIKRDMDASAGVRIVTVHGSKGLEAPVVFLIDTMMSNDYSENIFTIVPKQGNNPPIWMWSPRAEIVDKEKSARRSEISTINKNAQIAEYYRLLYVAMTRARDQLYIYGFAGEKYTDVSWHTHLWRILGGIPGAEIDKNNETIRITHVE